MEIVVDRSPQGRDLRRCYRRARARARGGSLIEIMIVVAIMALIASGVAVAVLPKFKEAQIKTASGSCRTIRSGVQDWQRMNPTESSCPSMRQLVDEKIIDSAAETNDPWGEKFTISCADDDVKVSSNGPDKKSGTSDDISVPKSRRSE